jgi:hypothetical protein
MKQCASSGNMDIVNVRMAENQQYAVPVEMMEIWDGGKTLIRFPAGNVRVVDTKLIEPATHADRKEFEAAQAAWKN